MPALTVDQSRQLATSLIGRGQSFRVACDGFLDDPKGARAHALASTFIDWVGQDGETYRRICITKVPGLNEAIERVFGPVEMFMQGYRLNYAGEMPNAAVHSDLGWGTHAAVVYLCEGEGGTAFWRHKATRTERIAVGNVELFGSVRNDWNVADAWEMTDVAPLAFNRAALYDGSLFHSRFPFEGFGSTPEDGRLIAVAFFTPEACK